MKRLADSVLRQWKNSPIRQPLLVRGARQVGKTFTVTDFGKTEFENIVTINFEENPEFAKCFSDFDPWNIINRISVLTRSVIKPGQTLLFLDEIQECPPAITSLRYFCENMPELHVIGAGSLVELALRSEEFRMPVGRIQSIYMYPMFFDEFLTATGEMKLQEYLAGADPREGIDDAFRIRLEEMVRQYLLVGGMPAAVSAYTNRVIMEDIQRLQVGLIRTYADDFAKYASSAKHKYLKEVFTGAPGMVGRRFKYSQINPDIQSKFLKEALDLLCDARCLIRICHASGAGVPLSATINERKFKVAFLDVGLMQNALGLRSAVLLDKSVMQVNAGGVAEQFVAQELLAGEDPYSATRLYFWAREAGGSSAEVDFLIEVDCLPLPVEVKAGARGTLKSMRIFLDEYPRTPLGVRYSLHELSYHDRILSIPLYMISQTPRLVRDCLSRGR